jgi:flagellin
MSVINTNINSLIAQNALKVNGRAMSKAMEQLATGSRINSAADDAAGLAVAQSMTTQIRGLNMAVRNANDAISLAQTAEGAMVEISNMLNRMRELGVQANTSALGSAQKGYLQDEFSQLRTQIANTVTNTKWNGMAVLSSTASMSFRVMVNSEVGASSTGVIAIQYGAIASGLASLSISGAAVGAAISAVSTALESVNSARASLGAYINRVTSAADNLTNIAQNSAESRSRIADTDYAQATMDLARTQIIQQAGTAILAQANQMPQMVLALLR